MENLAQSSSPPFLQWLLPVHQSGRSAAQLTEDEKKTFNLLKSRRPAGNCNLTVADGRGNSCQSGLGKLTRCLVGQNRQRGLHLSGGGLREHSGGLPEPGPQGQAGISCAPNPVSDHLRVYYALPAGAQVRVVLRDMAGRELMSAPQLHPHSEGYAEFQVAALPAGVYVAQVEVAGRLSAAAKVVKR